MPKHFQLFTSVAERKGSNPRPCQARHRDGNIRRNACPRSVAPRKASLLPLAGTWDSVSGVQSLSEDER
jgi:hypothetical protein